MTLDGVFLNVSIISAISILVAASSFLLGLFVYLNDTKNILNRSFFALTFFTALWIMSVQVAISVPDAAVILFSRRLALAAAVWIGFLIYYFSYYFPRPNKSYQFPFMWVAMVTIVISVVSLFTSYVLSNVTYIAGQQRNVYGFGYYVFAAFFIGSLLLGIYNSLSKRSELNREERIQINLVMIGLVVSGAIALTTNLILPQILGVYDTGQFGPLAVVIFVCLATFAMVKHHLFNVKTIAVELLVSGMGLVILLMVLFASSNQDKAMDLVLLAITIIVGTVLIDSVISEERQKDNLEKLDKDLELANNRYKLLDQARKEFLSFVSHQLRTPMTVIKGYASYLREDGFYNSPDKVKDLSNKITDAVDRMDSLIASLLDARTLEEGKMNFAFQQIDFVKLANSVFEELKSSGIAKNLALSFETAVPSITVSADQIKLRQCVQNLIDNAIKYTSSGFVKVRIRTDGEWVTMSVQDSGYGLSDQVRGSLFQEFVRDSAVASKVKGLGLGLYITKEIIKAHGGEISADSEGEGKGSVFAMKLKVTPQ